MKKTKLFLTVFVASMFMLLTSCGGGSSSNNPSDNSIVGSWKIVKAEGTSASMNEGVIYEFNDDGSAKTGPTPYKYTTSSDTLVMDYNGEGSIVLTWVFSIDGNKMTMENTSSDQKFWLEK